MVMSTCFSVVGLSKKFSYRFLYILSLLLLLGLKLDLLIANKTGFKMPSTSLLLRLACYLQTCKLWKTCLIIYMYWY